MSSSNTTRDLALIAGGVATGAVIAQLLASRRTASKALPGLVLHLYDHCPFCIRVELVLGWKGIAYERKVYGYGS